MNNAVQKAQPVEAPAVQDQTTAMLAMLERAARDPNVDIEKMERLFAMQERMMTMRSEQEFNAAFARAQKAMAPVARNKRNTQTNSNYADLAAINDAITPIYTEHGFGMTFSTLPSEADHVGVAATLTHEGGFSKDYAVQVPLDAAGLKGNANKTATHAYGSTLTYGRRYAKLMVWDIATEDDTDAQTKRRQEPEIELINEAQETRIRDLLEAIDMNPKAFCTFYKIERVGEIPQVKFDTVIRNLEAKKAKMQEAKQ